MCKNLSASALTDEGEAYPGLEHPIYFDEEEALQQKTGYCTCWITKPEGAELLTAFTDQCIKPLLAEMSWGKIIIEVH